MAMITILIGITLMALGGYYYFLTSALTALIPAYFGVAFLLLGTLAAIQPRIRYHYMHFIALLSLVGTVGGLMMAVPKAMPWFQGDITRQLTDPANRATVEQLLMSVLCLMLMLACVNSFIAARKRRRAEALL